MACRLLTKSLGFQGGSNGGMKVGGLRIPSIFYSTMLSLFPVSHLPLSHLLSPVRVLGLQLVNRFKMVTMEKKMETT